MPSVTLYANKSAGLRDSAPTGNFSTGTAETLRDANLNRGYLLCGFGEPASELKYKKISTAVLYAYLTPQNNAAWCALSARALLADFAESTVTFNTAPDMGGTDFGMAITSAGYAQVQLHEIYNALRRGVEISSDDWCSVQTSRSSSKPYIVINYEDTAVTGVIQDCAPASGYVPKSTANTFSWSIGKSGICYGDITQTAAIFRWRSAAGAAATEISCGTVQHCTLPAGTLTTAAPEWQISVTTNTGETITSPWYTMSTIEAASTATAVSPQNTIVDGSKATKFVWQHLISTGTAQSSAELQTSADGSTWAALSTVTGAADNVTIPADTLSSNIKYWRVRTYNTDNTAGTWSESAEIAVVAAPAAPVVTVATASPRPVISWQAIGQQAYDVVIGTWASSPQFGPETSCRCGTFLADGIYTAKVRVQNKYGLWSGWGTASFAVSNTAGAAIALTLAASYAAALSWTTAGNYAGYIVTRDGIPIASVAGLSYTDHFSLGKANYQVRGIYADSDNYGLSNAVSVQVTADVLMICDVTARQWLRLALSEQQIRVIDVSHSCGITYNHLMGTAWPVAEKNGFEDKTVKFDCAFADRRRAAEFEALAGRTVCVKTPGGDMVIGVLDAVSKSDTMFYPSYSAAVSQCYWPEEIKI